MEKVEKEDRKDGMFLFCPTSFFNLVYLTSLFSSRRGRVYIPTYLT